MRKHRLFGLMSIVAILCLGLAVAGGAAQGQDSPPNGSPTFAPPGVVFPTATPLPLPVTTTPTPTPTQLGLGGPDNASLAVVSPYTYVGPTYAVIAQSDTAGLDAAMARANLIPITAPAYQIFTLGGVYRPTRTYVMEKNVEIIGEGIDQTIIDRDSAIANTQMATFFVIRDDNPNDATPISMTLRNLTVRNGLATAIGLAEYGGGLSAQSGATLRIFDAKIENNQALLYGGGIYNQGGKVVLERVLMVGNKGGQGGGLYNQSVLASPLTATCVRFKGNGVAGSPGGGVAASYGSAIIRHSSFIGNIGFGADIYNNFFASTDAKNNYWAATPSVSGSVNVSLPYPAGQDPTLPYDTPSLWYDPTAYTVYPDCVMRPPPAFPLVLQATPTPTPLVCPWDGELVTASDLRNDSPKKPKEEQCKYEFDETSRRISAEWAKSWSVRACPLFCAFQFFPYVDRSLTTTPIPIGGYACAKPEYTDCANFVSEALFLGGLPMSRSWFCEVNTSGLCIRGTSNGRPSGWAYAPRNINGGGLPSYLGDRFASGGTIIIGLGGLDTTQSVIVKREELRSLLTASEFEQLSTVLQSDPILPPNAELTNTSISLPTSIPNDINLLGTILRKIGIGAGDIMYTNEKGLEHVFLVVGWGPYVESWTQLQQVDLNNLSLKYNSSTNSIVPYVIDHGPQTVYAAANPNANFALVIGRAKPYYASRWKSVVDDTFRYVAGDRNFVKIPDNFMLPLSDLLVPNGTTTLRSQMQQACPQ
jgi:hypothetical protein